MLRELSDRADANGEFIAELVGVCSVKLLGIRGQQRDQPGCRSTRKIEETRRTFPQARGQDLDVCICMTDTCIDIDC
jgi:hypothetical protein